MNATKLHRDNKMNDNLRLKEHQRYVCLKKCDKSPVAERTFSEAHNIQFQATALLAKTTGFNNQARRETIEILQHPNNINIDAAPGPVTEVTSLPIV